MSGFEARFPDGLRRGRSGRGQNRDRDAPTAADRQCTAPAAPQEPQHHDQHQMAEVEAQGYTLPDPLEAEEFTGGAQWEEDIEEPPPMLGAQLDPLHAHWAGEQPAEPKAGESSGQTERRRRFADIELTQVRSTGPTSCVQVTLPP